MHLGRKIPNIQLILKKLMEGRVGPGKEKVSKFTVKQNFPLPTVTQNNKCLRFMEILRHYKTAFGKKQQRCFQEQVGDLRV